MTVIPYSNRAACINGISSSKKTPSSWGVTPFAGRRGWIAARKSPTETLVTGELLERYHLHHRTVEKDDFVPRCRQAQSREARVLPQRLADWANLPRSVLHGVGVQNPSGGEMENQVLAVCLDKRQSRAADALRSFAPPRGNLDPIHALPHQLSQRVTPARYCMTFSHGAREKREECRFPRSSDLFLRDRQRRRCRRSDRCADRGF